MHESKPASSESSTQSPSTSSQQFRTLLSPASWVTVRAWRAINSQGTYVEPKDTLKGGGQVGHVSVQTNRIYASLWPTTPFHPNKITPVQAAHMSNPAGDIASEQRRCDSEETLYSLDEAKVEEEFNRFERERLTSSAFKKDSGWSAAGSKPLNQYRGENCSGLAYRLLRAGGINNLSDKCKKLGSQSTPVTPNEMYECIADAKKHELERFPETRSFKPVRR